jgi:hypothetical protein
MPILLNRERVFSEIMELARIKISSLLKVPIEEVEVKWEHKDGKMIPSFSVDPTKIKNMSEDAIKQAMGAVWRWLKDSLSERLGGLEKTRYGEC